MDGGEVLRMAGTKGAEDGENHSSSTPWGIGALVTWIERVVRLVGHSSEQRKLTNKYTFGPEACVISLTRESFLVLGSSGVRVIDDLVLPVILCQKHIGK